MWLPNTTLEPASAAAALAAQGQRRYADAKSLMWTLIILIGLAWGSYPFAGAVRNAPRGFSCVAELLVFPAVFLGVAAAVDYFVRPWGSCLVGAICLVMLAIHACVVIRHLFRRRPSDRIAA